MLSLVNPPDLLLLPPPASPPAAEVGSNGDHAGAGDDWQLPADAFAALLAGTDERAYERLGAHPATRDRMNFGAADSMTNKQYSIFNSQ